MCETRFHAMPDGRKIAFRKAEGMGPTLVFLPGYMSDMAGGKATAYVCRNYACGLPVTDPASLVKALDSS